VIRDAPVAMLLLHSQVKRFMKTSTAPRETALESAARPSIVKDLR